MNVYAIENIVRRIVTEITGLSRDVPVDVDLYLDLGIPSVQALLLLTELEEQFEIRINDDDFVDARSITKLVSLISGLAKQGAESSADA